MGEAGTVAGEAPGTVYRLRVVLSGISPMIWRQLEVPATLTLAELHEVLQISFAWSGEHLYRFTVHGREFGSGELWLTDPSRVCLADLGLRERERFTYAYDFFSPLGCWSHDLRVEAISPSRPRRRYPWCSGGARSAPPEDCGGAEAFLALRQKHSLVDTTLRMAELTGLLLKAPPSSTVREVLGEALEELPGLLYWSGIEGFDRVGLNRTLTMRPDHPT
ncbi:MAG TPA: plasmid pRiA4b ORF-3 family protein [Pseudonocardiaceae bacterium]|nr:plasmid pRiA4b ORF-3 family protein [Pseudonocardiaceae bacterium]